MNIYDTSLILCVEEDIHPSCKLQFDTNVKIIYEQKCRSSYLREKIKYFPKKNNFVFVFLNQSTKRNINIGQKQLKKQEGKG